MLDYILLHCLINGNEVHTKKKIVFILLQSDHESLVHPARHYNSLNLTYVIYTIKRNLIVKGDTLACIIQC